MKDNVQDISSPTPPAEAPVRAAKRSLPPPSAVSNATGLVGLAALGVVVAYLMISDLPRPVNVLMVLAGPALAMIAWVCFVEKGHRNPTTGLDFSRLAPLGPSVRRTIVKLVGLWSIWGLIGIAYWSIRVYDQPDYALYFSYLQAFFPNLLWLSVIYVLVVDRYSVRPTDDGAWHAGNLFLGRWSKVDWAILVDYALGWVIKAFFLAYMMSALPRIVDSVIVGTPLELLAIISWCLYAIYLVDAVFASVGYIVAIRFLDTHIRSANPYMAGWVAALICYPPLVVTGTGLPLEFRDGTGWNVWVSDFEVLKWIWGSLVILLTAISVWATMIFGLRFSNLTHRGIITNGPYRYTKHPSYITKNLFWWCAHLPFLSVVSTEDAIRNTVSLLVLNLIYYWRAKTEEKHLLSDPVYREYADWIDEHGLFARLGFRKRKRRDS